MLQPFSFLSRRWSFKSIPGLIGTWNPNNSLTTYEPNVRPAIGEPIVRVTDPLLGVDLEQRDGNRQPLFSYLNGVDASNGYAYELNGVNSQLRTYEGVGLEGDVELSVYGVGVSTSTINFEEAFFGIMVSADVARSLTLFGGFPSAKHWGIVYRGFRTLAQVARPVETPFIIGYRRFTGIPGPHGNEVFEQNGVVAPLTEGSTTNLLNMRPDNPFVVGTYNVNGSGNTSWTGRIGTIVVYNRRLTDREHNRVLDDLKRIHNL